MQSQSRYGFFFATVTASEPHCLYIFTIVAGPKNSLKNIITERIPASALKFSEISKAVFFVIPEMRASHSGWFSITSKVSSPNSSTIFIARFAPIPFIVPDAR